jgi:hypothetical protein
MMGVITEKQVRTAAPFGSLAILTQLVERCSLRIFTSRHT